MTLLPGKPTSVSVSGVDITSHVAMIRFEEPIVVPAGQVFVMPPLIFRGSTLRLTPAGYQLLFRRSHPRIRRMHSAYRLRRGKSRW